MATTLGWVLGRFVLPNLAFATIGIALGILQWFILQHHIHRAYWWIIATTVGFLIGSTLLISLLPEGMDFLAGAILGVTTGTGQWLVLRRAVYWSGWWIVINVVAWTTGMALLPGILLTGVVVGVITGIAMELLLRSPKLVIELQETE